MKEVGHVQNWATTIEADMRTISTALEYAYKGKDKEALHKGGIYISISLYMKIVKTWRVEVLVLLWYKFSSLGGKSDSLAEG